MLRGAILTLSLILVLSLHAAEPDALAISQNIQALHLPYGTILDPIFAAPDSTQIVNYTRCGDSAIWTGHYLAAETFRYVVTHSDEALKNAVGAINGLRSLVDVTGTNLLARCAIPANSPYADGISSEEAHNGIHTGKLNGQDWIWVGHTSRDQYVGVFFGLSIAFDGITDAAVRASISDVITRMLDFLRSHDWSVEMPDGSTSTTFAGRFDQQLSFLAVGRQVNGNRFGSPFNHARPFQSPLVVAPVGVDALDTASSYFKFNLDTVSLYDLIRLDNSSYYRWWYDNAYDVLRDAVKSHGNPHFNMIDRSLKGPNDQRDAETRALLEAWLRRPRRDVKVDLRGVVPACGDIACDPVPVEQRVTTDFLWQRSPFQLFGGGDGLIENAGIDYILPYWMARYYGVVTN